MAYSFHELKLKTIQELREIAKDVQHDAVQGYSQMNKDHLLPALCKALGIDTHEHLVVVGIDKPAIKLKMRELQEKRDAAREAHDHALLKSLRRQIHGLNRQIRAHVARQPWGRRRAAARAACGATSRPLSAGTISVVGGYRAATHYENRPAQPPKGAHAATSPPTLLSVRAQIL